MNEGLLDSVVRLYAEATGSLLPTLLPVALGLAGALLTIQLAWDFAMYALMDSDRAFAKAVRRATVTGILYGLVSIAPTWLPEILHGFEVLGQRVTGLTGLSPSALFGQGLDLGFSMFDSWDRFLSALVPGIGAMRTGAMLVVIIAFALIAIQAARHLIEASISLGGLVIFLGFSTHRFTLPIAEGYLRYLLDLGIRIYVLFLVLSVGRNLGREWDQQLQGLALIDPRVHFTILASAVLLALLAWTLPATIAGRLTSSFSLSGFGPLRDDA